VAALANSSIACASLTSKTWVVTLREWSCAISVATACQAAPSRSASARLQPRAASSIASERPMPLAAPVTAAVDPAMAVIVLLAPLLSCSEKAQLHFRKVPAFLMDCLQKWEGICAEFIGRQKDGA